MSEYQINIYTKSNGKEPFVDWLLKLDTKTQDRIMQRISRLRDGNFGDCKSIDNIYELRFFFGSGYRVYFAKENNKIVILLCGGDKKTQNKDINKAKQLLEDYKNE
jgi:putative addiction module killer protein